MATLNDPDQLTDSLTDDSSTNLFIDIAAKTIKLVPGQGGLVARDGVILQAIYSKVVIDWGVDPLGKGLAGIDFPFQPITDEFYELINGWDWADETTRQSVRRGGWLVRNTSGGVTQHWAAVAILNAETDDQCYYDLGAGAVDFTFPGNTAEAIQVLDDPNGDGNYTDGYDRSGNVTVFNREQGQLFATTSTQAAGEASLLAPKLFSLGLPTGADLNITANDTTVSSTAPYTGMSITYFSTPQSRNIGGTNRDFGVILDANNGTAEQLYEFVQYQLRQAGDIDAGGATVLGQLADALLQFTGGTGDGSGALSTLQVTNPEGGGSGVYIDNFSATDTNRLTFVDNTGAGRTFPFVAAGTLVFNETIQNDPNAVYRVYFSDGVTGGNAYGSGTAIFVQNNAGADLSGSVGGNATIAFDFDFDGNTQGGRTAGTAANVTAVVVGRGGTQYVKATATINRSTTNVINFVGATERNFNNPA